MIFSLSWSLLFLLKAQTYSALFHGIQQQREQQLSELRHRHGDGYSSPSSTYISDDDDDNNDEQRRHCSVTAASDLDLDLVHCADLGRFRSATVDGVSHT